MTKHRGWLAVIVFSTPWCPIVCEEAAHAQATPTDVEVLFAPLTHDRCGKDNDNVLRSILRDQSMKCKEAYKYCSGVPLELLQIPLPTPWVLTTAMFLKVAVKVACPQTCNASQVFTWSCTSNVPPSLAMAPSMGRYDSRPFATRSSALYDGGLSHACSCQICHRETGRNWNQDSAVCNTKEKCLFLSEYNKFHCFDRQSYSLGSQCKPTHSKPCNRFDCLHCSERTATGCDTKERCTAASPNNSWICIDAWRRARLSPPPREDDDEEDREEETDADEDDEQTEEMHCHCKRCAVDDTSGCDTKQKCLAASPHNTFRCNGPSSNCVCLRCTASDTSGCDTEEKCIAASPLNTFRCQRSQDYLNAHAFYPVDAQSVNGPPKLDDGFETMDFCFCHRCAADDLGGCITEDKCHAASPSNTFRCHPDGAGLAPVRQPPPFVPSRRWNPGACMCQKCDMSDKHGCNTTTTTQCRAALPQNESTWYCNTNEEARCACLRCTADDKSGCTTKELCLNLSKYNKFVCLDRACLTFECRTCSEQSAFGCVSEEACVGASLNHSWVCRTGNGRHCRCQRCATDDTSGCNTAEKCLRISPYNTFRCYDDECENFMCSECSLDNPDGCWNKEKCLGASASLAWFCGMPQETECSCRRCTQDDVTGCSEKEACIANGGAWHFDADMRMHRCGDCSDRQFDGYSATEDCECKAAPCNVTKSNKLAGLDCSCADGYEGTITWKGPNPQGTCTPKICNIANSNLEAGPACACKKPFFHGSIIWRGPNASGACNLQLGLVLGVSLTVVIVLVMIVSIVVVALLVLVDRIRFGRRRGRATVKMSPEACELSSQLLTEAGLQGHIQTFQDECISVDALKVMPEEELEGLGLKQGQRALLRSALERY